MSTKIYDVYDDHPDERSSTSDLFRNISEKQEISGIILLDWG